MNNSRMLVGLAFCAFGSLALAQPEYTIDYIEYPPNGFALYPMAINNSGAVVGWWYGSPVTNREPFIYTSQNGYVTLPKPTGYQHSVPFDMTNSGVIVGMAQTTWNDETHPRGWKYANGQFTLFPIGTSATGINESGLIVGKGCVDSVNGNVGCFFSSTNPPSMNTFPGAGGYGVSMWKYIVVNDAGEMAYTTAGNIAVFRDANGTVTQLPPPPAGWTGIRVDGINNAGQVIARWTRSTISPQLRYYSRGFIWSLANGAQEFGITQGSVRPQGINNLGQVVLESGTHDFAFFDTWIWSPQTGPINLDNKIDTAAGLVLTDIYGINDAGQILAGGDTITPPADVYVILNPTTPPGPTCDSIDFNNDTSLFDPQDIEAFLSVYSEGPCVPASATCNDIDFNNDTSTFDPCDINSFLVMYSEGPCTTCGT